MYGTICLNVHRHYLRVTAEIDLEGVASPSSFHLDGIERQSPQEKF